MIKKRCTECESGGCAPSSSSTHPPVSIFSAESQDHTGFSFGSTQETPSIGTTTSVEDLVQQMKETTLTNDYRCSVCQQNHPAKALCLDGANLAWRANKGTRERTEYWCLLCAVPTCTSCGVRPKTAVDRTSEVFVNMDTREWYPGRSNQSLNLR